MPYKDPAVQKAYNQRKSREHYRLNRQQYIDRSAARKRRLRAERTGERAMSQEKKERCPKCRGKMILEDVGGRQFLECKDVVCGGRILLNQPNTDYTPPPRPEPPAPAPTSADVDEERPTTRTIGRGKRPPLSESSRRRIGEGVRRAALVRKGQAPPAPDVVQALTSRPSQTPPIEPVRPDPQVSTLAGIDEALTRLRAQEERLCAELEAVQEKQAALRVARTILQEVQAA